jgi:hypothetical protein
MYEYDPWNSLFRVCFAIEFQEASEKRANDTIPRGCLQHRQEKLRNVRNISWPFMSE